VKARLIVPMVVPVMRLSASRLKVVNIQRAGIAFHCSSLTEELLP
jgi:hypothetical protein